MKPADHTQTLFVWIPFLIIFAFYWRVYDLVNRFPGFGDSLEIIWGIMWYGQALSEGANPLYYPLVFHPEGWQVGILAHPPLLFLLAQPFHLLGGPLFAYNLLAILAFVVSYAGAIRFFRSYTDSIILCVAVSLVYTFVAMRSTRVASGHFHVLWATTLLPWMGWLILNWGGWCARDDDRWWPREVWLVGLIWGLMISFSLYYVFLPLSLFLLLGGTLFSWRTLTQLLVIALIAAGIGSGAILPYLQATQAEPTLPPDMAELVVWGANINMIFAPAEEHTLEPLSAIARTLRGDSGRYLEANTHNLGLLTLIPLLFGLGWQVVRRRYALILCFFVPLLFSLGPFVKIEDQLMTFPAAAPLNQSAWAIGHQLKPSLFPTAEVPEQYAEALPSVGLWLNAMIPNWESARVTSRYLLIAWLSMLALVVIGFEKMQMPAWLKYTLLILWLVEGIGFQTGNRRFDLETLHPTHAWLIDQPLEPNEGVVDLDERIIHGPVPLLISIQTGIPTASGIGSFLPAHNRQLVDQVGNIVDQPHADLQQRFQEADIRYLLIHDREMHGENHPIIQHLGLRPDLFRFHQCASPPADYRSSWAYPICAIEVLDGSER